MALKWTLLLLLLVYMNKFHDEVCKGKILSNGKDLMVFLNFWENAWN